MYNKKINYNDYTNSQLQTEIILRFGVGAFNLFITEKCNDVVDTMYDSFRTWALKTLGN